MRFLGRAITGGFLFLVTVSLLAVGGYRLYSAITANDDQKTVAPKERSYIVQVQKVKLSTLKPALSFFGEVQAWRQLEVRAARAGAITALASQFRDGGLIEQGELLYSIDAGTAENVVSSSNLSLLQARTELEEAQSARQLTNTEIKTARRQVEIEQAELNRQQDLFEKSLVSQSAVEQAESALASARQILTSKNQALLSVNMRSDNAELAVERASLGVDDARQGLEETTLVAPFRGILAETSAHLGGRVGVNEKLAHLIDPQTLEVSFRVEDADFASLLNDKGTALQPFPVRVSLEFGTRTISMTGELDRMAATVERSRGGRLIFARLNALENTIIRPGDFVTVSIEAAPVSDVFTLPARSVSSNNTVLIVGEDDRLLSRQIEVIHREADSVIVNGLENGLDVVIDPKPQIGPGVKVVMEDRSDPGERVRAVARERAGDRARDREAE